MSDSGAQSGLTIPVRKIVALGLTPISELFGGKKKFKGAGNDTFYKLKFSPQVILTVNFTRPGAAESESRSTTVSVWCHEKAYLAHETSSLEPQVAASESPYQDDPHSVTKTPLSPTSPSTRRNIIAQVELKQVSPIRHRSMEHPDDRATIGIDIMHELGVHINPSGEMATLEIEEETVEYED